VPFTITHVVAILPLTTPRLSRWFSPTALAIGAMVPDVPLMAPFIGTYGWSHDLAIGPITYNLVVGLVVFALWTFVLRRPLTDLAPDGLRARLAPARAVRGRGWLVVVLSLVVGAYTHLIWDSFTHANRWGTNNLPLLNAYLGPLPVFKWLQHGCGILGMVFLGWWLVRWWRRTSPHPVPVRRSTSRFRRLTALTLPLSAVVVFVVVGAVQLGIGRVSAAGLLTSARSAEIGVAAVLMVSCLSWWLRWGRERLPR
jgi:hypothetical protein